MEKEERNGGFSFKLEERGALNTNENQHLLAEQNLPLEEEANSAQTVAVSSHLPTHGISVLTCALFIVGEMASGGILALPYALANSGWSGVIMLFICAPVALYCGILLGKCWVHLRATACMEEAFPRDPYPTIGYQCYGRVGRAVVEFCLLATLIGAAIIMLLISAQNISSIAGWKIGSLTTAEGETRVWLLIISAFLLPCTYLGTLKDIWPFAIMATVTTSTACCLIVSKCLLDWPSDLGKVPQSEVTVESFFRAFGTVSFAYGGASLFPSYQADMKKPEKFTLSATLAFVIVVAMYAPASILPFVVYGERNSPNILQTIKYQGLTGLESKIGLAAEILITFHLMFAFVIVLNPVFQQIEEYLKLPNRFGWKRCLLRTVIFLVLLGIAEAVPHFGVIVSLVGGTTTTMMTYILPCVFYSKLHPDLPLYIKVLHLEIIVVAVGSGVAVTYSSALRLKETFLSN